MKLGFTAIELLITMAIISILVLVGIPLFSHMVESNKLKAAATYFSQQLRYAKSEAIKSHNNVTVVFQPGSTWCYGITKQATCSCNISGSCELASVSYADYTHTSLAVTGFANQFYFEGARGLINTSGSVTFSIGAKYIKVSFNKLGNTSICSSGVGGYPAC